MRRLALLLCSMVLPAGASADSARPALESAVRLGVEGGAAWFNAFPDEAIGPAALVRGRVQITDRILINLAMARLDQPWNRGSRLRTTLVPVTLDLRLDRAPLAPYIGGGIAAVHIGGVPGIDWGGVIQAGFEWEIARHWAISTQATYAGVGAVPGTFPFFSTLTTGLSVGL